MNEEPPDHVSSGPRRNQQPVDKKAVQETRAQLEGEAARVITHFNNPSTHAELSHQLPQTTKVQAFVDALKMALLKNVRLAAPPLRHTLLRAVAQAARVGLLPDGKEGALVIRNNWDPDTRQSNPEVCWQPMVWGIVKLGRQTGSIKTIRANIVFNNEPFRYLQGDEDRIEHEVEPDIVESAYADLASGLDQFGNPLANVDRFFTHVRGAYCVITPVQGDPIKRYMTRARLMSLKQSAKAKTGPWNGRFVDEMILKAVILFTAKWINLDGDTVAAQAFQSALLTDQEIDFDAEPISHEPPRLEAPGRKLDAFEQTFGKPKEKVEVQPEVKPETKPEVKTEPKKEPSDFPGDDNYKPPPPKTVKRSAEGDERAKKWAEGIIAEIGLRVNNDELDAIENDADFNKRLDYLRHVDLSLAEAVDGAMAQMRETLKGL